MSSGTGTGMDNSITESWEQEGNRKNTFPKFGIGKEYFLIHCLTQIDISCISIGIEDLHKLELLLKQRH